MPSASELVQSCTTIFTLPEIYSRVREVAGDPEVLDPNRRHDALPFEPNVITVTLFAQVDLPALLTEARHQLRDTLALIPPSTMAA